jgi:hypothetical protein
MRSVFLTSRDVSFTIGQWSKSLDLVPKTKGNIRSVMDVIFNCAMSWPHRSWKKSCKPRPSKA